MKQKPKKSREEMIDMIKNATNKTPKAPKKYNPLIALFVIAVILSAIFVVVSGGPKENINDKIGLNQVVTNYLSGSYQELIVEGNTLTAKKPERTEVVAGKNVSIIDIDKIQLPPRDSLTELGFSDKKNNTKITIKDDFWGKFMTDSLPGLIGMIILVVIVMLMFTRMSGGGGGPMAFIKSRARIYEPGKDRVTFADVAGSAEEKEDLAEVVDFLKNPKKFRDLGAKIPRGILMAGPPGTGKTLLARAVAGESNVPFFSISGSEFVEMFVGVGASRVRDLFKEAKERAPAIIFIDEIDAIGKKRSPGIGGGHDEREQTLNQLLTEMDGFENDTSIIVLAATNRADVLDKALLRPGRFDRKVTINLPNLEDRIKILEVHAKGKPIAEDVDLRKISSSTIGFSGADLGNLLNEAAILTGRLGLTQITQATIQQSIEKVLIGNTKKSSRMTDLEKKITAYHEVGHAIVGKMLANTDPVHKISIIPRGNTGGVTWFLPEKDTTYITKAKYFDELVTFYGGRVAEEVFFGKDYVTTGASNDIERATAIARAMVMRYGFDDELGPENFASDAIEGNYLGSEGGRKIFSDKTQEKIDEKVRGILMTAYEQARLIITQYRSTHEKIAEALLVKEEMLAAEFDEYFTDIAVPKKTVA
ncbi:MAG: ATP-dependent zinc metalloprotease FtsH [Patescibacteria group bacterium]